jgi:hypothetical protein
MAGLFKHFTNNNRITIRRKQMNILLDARPIRGGENMYLSRVTFAGQRDKLTRELKEQIAYQTLCQRYNCVNEDFDMDESLDGRGDLLIVTNNAKARQKLADTYFTITVR